MHRENLLYILKFLTKYQLLSTNCYEAKHFIYIILLNHREEQLFFFYRLGNKVSKRLSSLLMTIELIDHELGLKPKHQTTELRYIHRFCGTLREKADYSRKLA